MKILSLVSDLFVRFSNKQTSFLSTMRTFNPMRKSLLSHFENILRFLKEAEIVYFISFRSGEEGFTSDINPNGFTSLRKGLRRDIITGESSKPFISGCPANSDSFDVTFNRARESELESTDIPDSKVFALKFPAALFQSEAIISVSAFEARESRFLSILDPAKETFVGFIQTLKYILKYLRTHFFIFRESFFEFGKLFILTITGYEAVLPIESNALLKSSVVEPTTEVKPGFGLLESVRGCLNTILKRFSHLPSPISILIYLKIESKRLQYLIHPTINWINCGITK